VNADEVQRTSGDVARAQELARRYRCDYVDLHKFRVPLDILKIVPVELMFRYNFVPLEESDDGRIAAAFADPSQLMLLDEVSLLLGKRIIIRVVTLRQISQALGRVAKAHETDENITRSHRPENRLDTTIRMHLSERHSSRSHIHAQGPQRPFLSRSSKCAGKGAGLQRMQLPPGKSAWLSVQEGKAALALNPRSAFGFTPAANPEMLPQPKPRAMPEHFVVPPIRSRDGACTQRPNIRCLEHFL
jgi:Type II secretion system (T2SS), protein E, N-terminal domain